MMTPMRTPKKIEQPMGLGCELRLTLQHFSLRRHAPGLASGLVSLLVLLALATMPLPVLLHAQRTERPSLNITGYVIDA